MLVDKNDRFLGKHAPKSKCHAGQGLHHRAFTILIHNKKGRVLLQKRKHRLWGGFWDLTNSHPVRRQDGSKETHQQAARRCLKREWGIKTSVKKLFGFNYQAQFGPPAGEAGDFCENEYCAFLIGEYNGKVFPNPEVAYGYRWLPLAELKKEIKLNPQNYTPWLIKAVKEFFRRGLGKLATK